MEFLSVWFRLRSQTKTFQIRNHRPNPLAQDFMRYLSEHGSGGLGAKPSRAHRIFQLKTKN
jgi:hypothetical protein